ncbi:uncharacterized protein F54H12.2-like [Argopecten irradians]|uniref:uncharacterized protein F54H12.2-like n=1 Tax=Argopecten irradians TaxID=31199 RepID=UPI00370F7A35
MMREIWMKVALETEPMELSSRERNAFRGLESWTWSVRYVTICFRMDRYLINQVNVGIKLYRSKPAFSLLSGDVAPDYRIAFDDIRLRVCKVKINPAVIYAQSKALESTNAKYPFTQTMIKQMTIPVGATNFTYDNMFQGMRPNQVVVGFVKSTGATGDYAENPWYFQGYDVTNIGLYIDGIPVGGNSLKPKYGTDPQTISILRSMLQSTGKWLDDSGSNIERDDIGLGYALYTFDLEPKIQRRTIFNTA